MVEYVLLGIIAVAVILVLIGQRLNSNQIVAAQLATHKMMFPPQIRNARRVYWRGLVRQVSGMAGLNLAAKIISGLAGFMAFATIVQQFPLAFGALRIRVLRLVINFVSEIPYSGLLAAGLAIIAAILWLIMARFQFRQLTAADASHPGGPNDLYWTPPVQLRRQYQLKLLTHGLILVGAIIYFSFELGR
ncbi:hypothetical protein [Lacticaseibacillus brantae]|uniref:Integral membrane protein n=1 Tax=Lacticaseibacillus brantae DSM 23927 TaxID=1423727 RepID=A0A0R2B3U1_9LACO|nr:hypothetical protein [Lacticaseibacillus brantae]KRM71179.1 hypothetical protein FC34_GL001870 [Lacticaseibacillus brantae DSM 23927]